MGISRLNKKLKQEGIKVFELTDKKINNKNNVTVLTLLLKLSGLDDESSLQIKSGLSIKSPYDIYKPRVAKVIAYKRLISTPLITNLNRKLTFLFSTTDSLLDYIIYEVFNNFLKQTDKLENYGFNYACPDKKKIGRGMESGLNIMQSWAHETGLYLDYLVKDIEKQIDYINKFENYQGGSNCLLN